MKKLFTLFFALVAINGYSQNTNPQYLGNSNSNVIVQAVLNMADSPKASFNLILQDTTTTKTYFSGKLKGRWARENGRLYHNPSGLNFMLADSIVSGGGSVDSNLYATVSRLADTSAVLRGLIGSGGSADSVTFYTNYRADTSIANIYAAIAASGGATDSAIFATQYRLDTIKANRVRYVDTSSMFLPYLRKVDTSTLSNRINLKLNITDTANIRLRPIAGANMTISGTYPNITFASSGGGGSPTDTSSLSTRIDARVKYTDTASMLSPYYRTATATAALALKQNNITLTTVGTSGASTLVGSTLNIPNYAGGGGTIYDSVVMATVYGVDTGKARLTTSISTKQPQLSGTGFVKATGTTISYDNSTYLTTASASSTYAPKASPTFTGTSTNDYVNAKQYYSTPQTLSDGATTTWDANLGCEAIWTIGGVGRTLTITNPIAGAFYTLKIIQGTGGSKTITTYPTNTKWSGGTAPTLTTAAASVDIISFWYDGTNMNAMYSLDVK